MNRSHDLARALLQKARDDAYVVQRGAADPAYPDWVIGFHAQQAVEKAIKSVLCHNSIEYPHSHNIGLLAALAGDHGLTPPPQAPDLSRLTVFGAVLRYETGLGEDSPLDRAWAQARVQAVLTWAAASLA